MERARPAAARRAAGGSPTAPFVGLPIGAERCHVARPRSDQGPTCRSGFAPHLHPDHGRGGRGVRAARAACASRRAPTSIRVGVIGCGGRGTGAARDCLRGIRRRRARRARRSRARSAGAVPRASWRSSPRPTPAFAAKIKVTDDTLLHRLRRLPEGARVRRRPRDPRDAAGLPARAPRRGGRRRQARLRGEAGRGRRRRHPLGARDATSCAKAEGPRHRRRHAAAPSDLTTCETIERIQDGAIGDVVGGQVYWNQGGLWNARRASPSGPTPSGRSATGSTSPGSPAITSSSSTSTTSTSRTGCIGAHPVKAIGVGGRQSRTDPKYGHIYDHFAVEFEYPNGARVMSMCRQIDGTREPRRRALRRHRRARRTRRAEIIGREGVDVHACRRRAVNPYVQEHTDLIASIRAGKPLNELQADRREHAHRDHGPRGGVHRPGDDVGRSCSNADAGPRRRRQRRATAR